MPHRGPVAVALLLVVSLAVPTAAAQFPDHDEVRRRVLEHQDRPGFDVVAGAAVALARRPR